MTDPKHMEQLPEFVQADFNNRMVHIPGGGIVRREAAYLVSRLASATGNFSEMEGVVKELTMLAFDDSWILWLHHQVFLSKYEVREYLLIA